MSFMLIVLDCADFKCLQVLVGKFVMSAFSVVKNIVIVCEIGQFAEVLDVNLTPQMMRRFLGHFASLLSSFALRGSDRSFLPVMVVGGAKDGAR